MWLDCPLDGPRGKPVGENSVLIALIGVKEDPIKMAFVPLEAGGHRN